MFPALLSHALRRLLTALAARLFFRSGGLVLPFGRRVAMPAGTPFMASGARTSQSGRRIPHGAGGRTQSVTRAGVAASGRCRKCPCGFSLPFRRKRSAVWPFLSQRQDFLSAVLQILPAGFPNRASGSCRRLGRAAVQRGSGSFRLARAAVSDVFGFQQSVHHGIDGQGRDVLDAELLGQVLAVGDDGG